jgi:hypothetical protein
VPRGRLQTRLRLDARLCCDRSAVSPNEGCNLRRRSWHGFLMACPENCCSPVHRWLSDILNMQIRLDRSSSRSMVSAGTEAETFQFVTAKACFTTWAGSLIRGRCSDIEWSLRRLSITCARLRAATPWLQQRGQCMGAAPQALLPSSPVSMARNRT